MTVDYPKPEHSTSLRQLWKEAFGDTDAFLDMFFSKAFAQHRCRCITENNIAVAALYIFDCQWHSKKIAYIYAVATAKSHRGKGLCHLLMNDTHNLLKAMGYAGAILVPGSDSLFKFYETMGYKTCSYICEYTCETADKTLPLKEITKEEFCSLRKKYLPENSVLQENENLDFLGAYSQFYAGEDFILTAFKDNGKLICAEILGNTENSTKILATLNCTVGTFRTKGDSRPFAMHLSFEDSSPTAPSYFGFAFD